MKTCDICTLSYWQGQCPNGWRPDRNDVVVPRAEGKHQEARRSVERHRTRMAAVAA
jgi:hypothetical protein